MEIKNIFRGFGAYRAFCCGFGMYHELFLNPTLQEWMENGESTGKIVAGYCLAGAVSSFIGLGLVDGIVDTVKGTFGYFPLQLGKKLFPKKREKFKSIENKIFDLGELEI